MKKSKLLVFIVISLCFFCSSCNLSVESKPAKVWFVGYGARFQGLKYTMNDAVELGKAFKALSDKTGVEYKDLYFMDSEYGDAPKADNIFGSGWEEYKRILNEELTPDENDIVIFSFSSHGTGTFEKKYQYSSYEAYWENNILFYNQGVGKYDADMIPFSDLYEFIDGFAGKKFIICDTCYSGSLITGDGITVNKDIYKDTLPITLLFDRQVNHSSSMWVLSAGSQSEEVMEPKEYKHGVLTYCILKALGWNEEEQKLGSINAMHGNYISAGSISEYVYKNGGKYSEGKYHQTPVFSAGSSDLILFKF